MTRAQRLRLLASNYGRDFGWLVEHSGRAWASMTEPRLVDMFWVSYRLTPIHEEDAEVVLRREFWARDDLVFRNQETLDLVRGAFPALSSAPTPENPRVSVRGLLLYVPEPSRMERLLLWLRRS